MLGPLVGVFVNYWGSRMSKKYHLVCYAYRRYGTSTWFFKNDVIDISLADYILDFKQFDDGEYEVIWATEITKEDFEKLDGEVG